MILLKAATLFVVMGLLLQQRGYSQAADTTVHQQAVVSTRFFGKVEARTGQLDQSLTRKTTSYLDKLARLEDRLKSKLATTNSDATKNFPAGDYQQWIRGMQAPSSSTAPGKTYIGGLDTLRTTLQYLQSGQGGSGMAANAGTGSTALANASGQVQQLQAHLDQSALISQYISERKQQIAQYLAGYTHLPAGVTQTFDQYKATAYYYHQQVEALKNSLSDPQKIEQQAITQLSKVPAYQTFLAQHSMLASMFRLPAGYEDGSALQGLQTKGQVQQMLQQQVSGGGQGAQSAVDQQMQQAKTQLTNMQSNLSKYGVGGQAIDMPNFQPNQQKTKTFLKRLTYGANLQLSKSTDYFPATGNLGLTIGYKINDKSTVGVGASYNIGLGSDWGHMQFSSQGMGLISFMDWRIRKTYYVTGGYELNYMTQFNNIAQLKNRSLWQPSALIGLEKKYRISSKLQGNLQLLFDALYRQEIPAGQMIKFRVGYNF
jgi:hypothetical protein